jgi:hypothetical protein
MRYIPGGIGDADIADNVHFPIGTPIDKLIADNRIAADPNDHIAARGNDVADRVEHQFIGLDARGGGRIDRRVKEALRHQTLGMNGHNPCRRKADKDDKSRPAKNNMALNQLQKTPPLFLSGPNRGKHRSASEPKH